MSSTANHEGEYPQPIKGESYQHFTARVNKEQWEKTPPVCTVTEAVIQDLRDKTTLGLKKYGVTMDREDLSQLDWMRHHYSELQDALKYVKKQIIKLEQAEKDGATRA